MIDARNGKTPLSRYATMRSMDEIQDLLNYIDTLDKEIEQLRAEQLLSERVSRAMIYED